MTREISATPYSDLAKNKAADIIDSNFAIQNNPNSFLFKPWVVKNTYTGDIVFEGRLSSCEKELIRIKSLVHLGAKILYEEMKK